MNNPRNKYNQFSHHVARRRDFLWFAWQRGFSPRPEIRLIHDDNVDKLEAAEVGDVVDLFAYDDIGDKYWFKAKVVDVDV